jgi:hypothetical protein
VHDLVSNLLGRLEYHVYGIVGVPIQYIPGQIPVSTSPGVQGELEILQTHESISHGLSSLIVAGLIGIIADAGGTLLFTLAVGKNQLLLCQTVGIVGDGGFVLTESLSFVSERSYANGKPRAALFYLFPCHSGGPPDGHLLQPGL